MARIAWTVAAILDLDRIRRYIHEQDPAAAERIHAALRRAGESLRDFPNRGRPAPHGQRELSIVPPYVIRYRVAGDVVTIQSVIHGARRRD